MAVRRFLKNNIVFCVATVAAAVTCFLVPPDKSYLDYFDWKTLACLFLTLAVVCALRNIKFFTIVARRLVRISGNLRGLFLLLIAITFIGSMLIANDMALITFLPLGYFALSVTHQESYMAYLFILQNISANLGAVITGHADNADGGNRKACGNGRNGMGHKMSSFLFIKKCQRIALAGDKVHQHIGAHDGNIFFL